MGSHPRRADGRLRRDALLRAAVEVAGELGVGATTHRAVAARAGVPLAATSYYFDSMAQLLAEALRSAVAARVDQLGALAQPDQGSRPADDTPSAIASRMAAALTEGDRTASLAQLEAYLHAARDPAGRPSVARALAAFEEMAAAALKAAGARRPDEGARAFVALADGFLLHRLANPRPDDESRLRDAIKALFVAYAMTDEERRAWDERLSATVPERTVLERTVADRIEGLPV
jgi:DNA-binding transcriptional regulator YbjK